MSKRKPSPAVLKARKRLLARVGYTRMVERGLVSQRPAFPDLSVEVRVAPTSDEVGNGYARPSLPPDARQFPVGVSHKQGPMLITAIDRLEDMGGRKT